MNLRIYHSTDHVTRSIIRANFITEVTVDEMPDDELLFADEFDGDILIPVEETNESL